MKFDTVYLVLLFTLLSTISGQEFFYKEMYNSHKVRPGGWVVQTHGHIWPKPQKEQRENNFFSIDPKYFSFELDGTADECDIAREAVKRYETRMFNSGIKSRRKRRANNDESADHPFPLLKSIKIILGKGGCEQIPHLEMEENYFLTVDGSDNSMIRAPKIWGLLRGFESLSQLVHTTTTNKLKIQAVVISDGPRFSHRGILVDTARHFLSKDVLLDNLDLMEMNKMNVMHWHLTDDQSFPFESKRFPMLSEKGAYSPNHIYDQEFIKTLIEAARLRGIRVVPEFDTPGHTQSWNLGLTGLLAECYEGAVHNGFYGPMDPTKNMVYKFLRDFFEEVTTVFSDKYVHLGGDEISRFCWESNPHIKKYMKKHNIGDSQQLESLYVEKLLDIMEGLKTKPGYIVWQEVFDNGDKVKEDTVIEIWKGPWEETAKQVTSKGLRAILSAPWYLNNIEYDADWVKMYLHDPHKFQAVNEEQRKLMVGGEACIWGEFVNSISFLPRLWPRASAVAERLWSNAADTQDIQEAAKRLQEHECRMLRRGFPIQPANGPGFCEIV